ncbi:MAG: hypothetical protein ACU0CC_11500 [Sagittula sp.]|uniref:hypothetical protein n=1 Tax=Sagittula sp. TaxID=2038081 RepID=UPI004059B660
MNQAKKPWELLFAVPVLALVLGAILWNFVDRRSAFATDGIEAEATLAGRFTRSLSQSHPKPPVTHYYAIVRFQHDGAEIEADAEVSHGFYRNIEAGRVVPVTYLRDDPKTVRIDERFETSELIQFALIALFLAGCAVVPFVFGWWKRRRTPV